MLFKASCLVAAVTVLAIPAAMVAPASADSCAAQVAQFEGVVRASEGVPGVGPTARETKEAKLSRQPTPVSVARAKALAQATFETALSQAKSFERQGDEASCLQALADARSLFALR